MDFGHFDHKRESCQLVSDYTANYLGMSRCRQQVRKKLASSHNNGIWETIWHNIHNKLLSRQHNISAISVLIYVVAVYAQNTLDTVVLVVQRFGVGFVIERSLVRLPAGALSSQLGQLSLPPLRVR